MSKIKKTFLWLIFIKLLDHAFWCPSNYTPRFVRNERPHEVTRLLFVIFGLKFQVWLVFLVPHLHFWKEWVSLPDAEFNAESIDINFKSQNWKRKNLVCPFLTTLFHFETNLIKWRLFLFYRPFWTVGKFLSGRSEAEKLAGTVKKNTFTDQPHSRGTFLLYTDKI